MTSSAAPLQDSETPYDSSSSKNKVEFKDHYSLGRSTELRFRGTTNKQKKAYVVGGGGRDRQLVITVNEETNGAENRNTSSTVSIQPSVHSKGNFGASLLQAIAAMASLFVLSVWIAFTMQCLFFLFMNVAGTSTPDEWTNNPPIGNLLGCIMACPLLVDSLAKILTMSTAFTVDCWRGISTHPSSLWKTNIGLGARHGEWFTILVFVGIPLLTFGIATLVEAGDDENQAPIDFESQRGWYEMTLLAWAGSIWIFQILYMELVVIRELESCHKLLKHYRNTKSLFESIRVNLLLTQRQKYSGVKRQRYLVETLDGKKEEDVSLLRSSSFSRDAAQEPVQYKYTLGTRLTKHLSWCYDKLQDDAPTPQESSRPSKIEDSDETKEDTAMGGVVKRNYTIDELFGNLNVVTKDNWSMEKLWCAKPNRAKTLYIVDGRASVTSWQFLNGYICVGLAMVLIVLAIAGAMEWLEKPGFLIFLVVIAVLLFCFLPMAVSLNKVRDHQKSRGRFVLGNDDDNIDEKSLQDNDDCSKNCQGLVSVWESVRVTELKEWACYTSAAMEFILFFLWPVVSLFVYGNFNIGVIFCVLGIHMVPSHYFNASSLLQECGPIDQLDLGDVELSVCPCTSSSGGENDGIGEERKTNRDLKNKIFLANIMKRATRSRGKRHWIGFLFFCFFVFCVAYYQASTEDIFNYQMGRYKWKGVVYADGFYWDPQPQLPYPTCEVKKGFAIPGQDFAHLADYAFLATLAFSSPEEAQPLLDQWFGNGTVTDDYEYVDSYRKSTGTEDHPVSYKLFTFAAEPTAGVVSIRGSETMWDWSVDAQLWIGGVLAQAIKHWNPLGYIWDPILDEVVYLINSAQSEKLKEISYYRLTSDFVETLYDGYEGRTYKTLRVTGASLGGGLAILTGAITGASAIAISGLNAMFSRRTFLPPITKEQLDTRVFNTMPARDLISRVDQPGMLHQRMQCIGPKNSLMGCHSMFRSLCEIQYRCGSEGRPINCWCVSKYGYQVPTQNGTITWEEACAEESEPPSK